MANRYWVGGTATWDGTAGTKWSTTSGGGGGAAVPTAADDVFFNGASGTVTVTTSGTTTDNCRSINFTGFTGTFSHATSTTVNVGDGTVGAFTMIAGMTYTKGSTTTSAFNFVSTTTGNNITTGGKVLGNVTFNGAGGGWTLQDTFNANGATTTTVTLTAGTLDTNGQTVNLGRFSSSNSNTRTITLGASTINLSATGTTTAGWNTNTTTNLTFNANTSTINFTSTTGNFLSANGTFNVVTFAGNTSSYTRISGSNTYATLTKTGGTGQNEQIYLTTSSSTQTITGTFTVTGNSLTNRVFVWAPFVTATISAAVVSLTNCDFSKITAAGAAIPFTGTSIGNMSGNSNITFTTPVTRYWVGNGGSWSSTARWSATSNGSSGASVPICHDTVIFDASSITSASQTITADVANMGDSVTFTGTLNSPTLDLSSIAHRIKTSLTYISTLTTTNDTVWYEFFPATSGTLISAGKTVREIDLYGAGSLLLGDNLTVGDLYIEAGTFDMNGFNMSTNQASGGGSVNLDSTVAILTMRTGNLTMEGDFLNTSGGIINCGTSTIIANGGQYIFLGGGATFYNYVGGNAGGGSINEIDDANIWNSITINPGTTLVLKNAVTQTVAHFYAPGVLGSICTLRSTTAASAATISKPNGIPVSVTYCSIKDSTATGALFWAGTNSTSVSGNTGWRFLAPPNSNFLTFF